MIEKTLTSLQLDNGFAAGVRRGLVKDVAFGDLGSEKMSYCSAGFPVCGLRRLSARVGAIAGLLAGSERRFGPRGELTILEKQRLVRRREATWPNQALLPTPMSVTIPADAGLAPAIVAADL